MTKKGGDSMEKAYLFDNDFLEAQIAENSRRIDQYLKELKELEIRLSGNTTEEAAA